MSGDDRSRFIRQVELLASKDWRVRSAAETALAQAGQPALGAVIAGLAHLHPAIRRHCAAFMDHHATDRCIAPLSQLLSDPVAGVRREAIHALGCQRCKPLPLAVDALPLLIERALNDPSKRVRLSAVAGIGLHPPDPRAIAPLHILMDRETDRNVRRHAHRALRLHDSSYRAATDALARALASADGPR